MRLLTGILFVLALSFFSCLNALSHTEERFGPWLYYAPYYFPPDGCCLGHCFSPDEFRPRYEAPNPPQPKNDAPPPCSDGLSPTKTRGRTAAVSGELKNPAPLKPISRIRPIPDTTKRSLSGSSAKAKSGLMPSSGQPSTDLIGPKSEKPSLISPPLPANRAR